VYPLSIQLFDAIFLIDFLKRADLRWNRRLEDMEELKNLQDELLDAASL
jgi:hypothetical protein